MRKEEFAKGNYVHVYNRGSRAMPIVCDAKDRWRFLQGLYYFNANFTPPNPFRQLRELLNPRFNSRFYEACFNEQDAKMREQYLKSGVGKRYVKNRLKFYFNLAETGSPHKKNLCQLETNN